MGSTGSGNFSDYSKRKPTNLEQKNGGDSGKDKCGLAFSTKIEEVGRCLYFISKHILPKKGTEVYLSFNGTRIAVETTLGEEIGYLPTTYNYIKSCMEDGFKYNGIITSSNISPSPFISVDITPA